MAVMSPNQAVAVPTAASLQASILAVAAATYAAPWTPATTYAAGQATVSPAGDFGTAKAGHTSGATYNPSKWTPIAALAPRFAFAAGEAFGQHVKSGVYPVGLTVYSDSTGAGVTRWPYLMTQWLATLFPAYTVTHRLWNDTLQCYDQPMIFQYGTGGDRSIRNGANTTYLTTPSTAAITPLGDLEVEVKVALDDWTPAAAFEIGGKSGSAGNVGWFIRIETSGSVSLFWSANGTATLSASSTVPCPFSDGATGYLKATLDVDNGASGRTVTFYSSTDGFTWNALGTPVTVAGVTSIFASTQSQQFISRGGGGSTVPGTFYHLKVFNGLGAVRVPIVDLDLDSIPLGGSSTMTFTDYTGNVWTMAGTTDTRLGAPGLAVFNGSTPGKAIAWSSDSTRFPLQSPYPSDLAFISYSHNEGGGNINYRPGYKALTDLILARWPDAGIVAVSQNPKVTPVVTQLILDHTVRAGVVASFAASQRFAYADVMRAFNAVGAASLTDPADGVHPTTAGSLVWLAVMQNLILPFLA